MKKNKNFDLVYNALSVGWHLRKIMELDPELTAEINDYKKLIAWLDRHEIKPK